MPELWLVCEGGSDLEVLRPVFTRVLAVEVSLRAAGGQGGLGAVAAFLAREEGSLVAYIEDRDYRPAKVAEAAFSDGRRRFLWRRHCIESYLVQPEVVASGLERLRADLLGGLSPAPAWDAPTVGALRALLRDIAELMAPHEAMELAIWSLRAELSDSPGRVQLRSPAPSGDYPSEAECLQALLEESARFAASGSTTAQSPLLVPQAVEGRFADTIGRIRQAEYLAEGTFLGEFHGKRLLRSLREALRDSLGIGIPPKVLREELEAAVVREYSTNRAIFGTDDFGDLAAGIRQLPAPNYQ